jgi:methionyl-tRNA formyltransferase
LLQLLSTQRVKRSELLVFTHKGPANQEFLDMLSALDMTFETESINKHQDRVGWKAMNLHPSLLPDYKGCLSSVHALLNGEAETGYTFHYVTPEVDAGNILLQERVPVLEEDTAFSLYHKLLSGFVRNFNTAFDRLVEGDPGLDQSGIPGKRRYFGRDLPHAGKLVASEVNFDFACRFVRAMHFPPFPGAIFDLADRELEILDPADLEPYRRHFQ